MNCSSITIQTQTIAIAILKLISAVGIVIAWCKWSQNIGSKNSRHTPRRFEINIIKKTIVIYIFTHLFSFIQRISSKNS